jgi:hypothetical protein
MVRTHSIATLAIAWFTIATPKTHNAAAPSPECDGPNAPVQAVVDSVKHTVVVTLGPCLVPRRAAMHGHDMPNDMSGHGMSGHNMSMMDHVMAKEDVRVHFRWPANVWVRSFDLQVFDKNHKPMVQSAAIHHMELFNFDRRQVVYPMVERLLGIGEETDGVKLPKSVGLPLDAGMDLGLSVRWNNQTDTDMQGVTLQLTLGYSPRNLAPRPTIVLPFKVDVNSQPGAGDAFTLPPGGGSRSTLFTVGVSGRLLAAGGHLHDFGKEVRLEDVATGKVLARARARRRPDGEVTSVSHSLYGVLRRGPHLIAGRQYRLVAVYEGSPNDSIRGAMGLMGGIFAPDRYAEWPKLDRTNADYLSDLKPSERTATEAEASATNDQPHHHHGR